MQYLKKIITEYYRLELGKFLIHICDWEHDLASGISTLPQQIVRFTLVINLQSGSWILISRIISSSRINCWSWWCWISWTGTCTLTILALPQSKRIILSVSVGFTEKLFQIKPKKQKQKPINFFKQNLIASFKVSTVTVQVKNPHIIRWRVNPFRQSPQKNSQDYVWRWWRRNIVRIFIIKWQC